MCQVSGGKRVPQLRGWAKLARQFGASPLEDAGGGRDRPAQPDLQRGSVVGALAFVRWDERHVRRSTGDARHFPGSSQCAREQRDEYEHERAHQPGAVSVE